MNSEQQYIELYEQTRGMIFQHLSEVMNAMRMLLSNSFVPLVFQAGKWNGINILICRLSLLLTMV